MTAHPLSDMFQEELYRFSPPVVVVLSRPWTSYSTEEQALLQKILTSIKTDIRAVQVVSHPSLELEALSLSGTAKVLVFGAAASEIPAYQEVTAHGFKVIRADDLSELNDEKKKSLWLALRQMFGV